MVGMLDKEYSDKEIQVNFYNSSNINWHPHTAIDDTNANDKAVVITNETVENSTVDPGDWSKEGYPNLLSDEIVYCQQTHKAGEDILYTEPIGSGKEEPKTMDWDIPLPKANGSYIYGRVQGVRAAITLDTSATHTFISDRFFHWIPKFKRPTLHGPGTLKQAGYGVTPILGRALFDLQLGPLKIK